MDFKNRDEEDFEVSLNIAMKSIDIVDKKNDESFHIQTRDLIKFLGFKLNTQGYEGYDL